MQGQSITRTERGQSLVELSLLLPVLSLLFFGGIELSRMLRYYQAMTMLARELGSVSYRRCATFQLDSEVAQCLQEVIDRTGLPATGVLPGARVVVSQWRWDGIQPSLMSSITGTNGGVSRIGASDFAPNSSLARLVFDTGVVVIAEVFIDYQTGVPEAFINVDREIYAVQLF